MAVAGRSTNEIGRMPGFRLSVQKYAAHSPDINDFIFPCIIIILTF